MWNISNVRIVLVGICILAMWFLGHAEITYETIGQVRYELNSATNEATVMGRSSGYPEDIQGDIVLETYVNGMPVTGINEWAFNMCSNITSFKLPSLLKSIGKGAFQGCEISEITIPEQVEVIGDLAFKSCPNLETVYFNAINCSMATWDGQTSLNPLSLKEVIFGDNVESVPEYAFSDCVLLTEIRLSKAVKVIGKGAFRDCKGLNKVELPGALEEIRTNAFKNCKGLETISIPASVWTIMDGAFEGSGLTTFNLPEKLQSIGEKAFYECPGPIELTIPSEVKYIGKSAFSTCTNIESVLFNAEECLNDDADSSSWELFPSSIKNVVIGEGVRMIPKWAFGFCSELKSIVIPESVEIIGRSAFPTYMERVEFKGFPDTCDGFDQVINVFITNGSKWCNTITEHGQVFCTYEGEGNLFINDTKVETLVLNPENSLVMEGCYQGVPIERLSVKADRIAEYAFASSSVREILLDVKEIESRGFVWCDEIISVYSTTITPPCAPNNVFSHYYDVTLYVPSGCKKAYEESEWCWSKFNDIREMDMSDIHSQFQANYTDDSLITHILTVGESTGIIDFSEPFLIYNVDGARQGNFDSLIPGLYILVQGEKSMKYLVKK